MLSNKIFRFFLLVALIVTVFIFAKAGELSNKERTKVTKKMPDKVAAPAGMNLAGTVRVMSFNVHGNNLCNSANDPELSTLTDYLFNNNVDVLVLQENDCTTRNIAASWQTKLPGSRISFIGNQVAVLTKLTTNNTPFNAADATNQTIPLQIVDGNFKYDAENADGNTVTRTLKNVIVNVNGVKARIIGIHPTNAGACDQINGVIKDHLATFTDHPTIIAGDYNCSARSFYKNPYMWFLQNYSVTCFNPNNPADFPYNASCGPSTKAENIFQDFTPPEEGGDPDSAQGPIDHVGAFKNALGAVQLDTPVNYKIIREQSLKFSDHNPVIADVPVYTSAVVNTPTPIPQAAGANSTMRVMTFNIKGCDHMTGSGAPDAGFQTAMANRVVDELLTKVVNGQRVIDVAFAGFQEVGGFCGVPEDERDERTQNPTEDSYFITALERYFVKNVDFFIYQRKVHVAPYGPENSREQMIISKYPFTLINETTTLPITIKANVPGTSRPVYVSVIHARNTDTCVSNEMYISQAENNSEGSNNIIFLGDFNTRYYNETPPLACLLESKIKPQYTYSLPYAGYDLIDYIMANKQSDWTVTSTNIDTSWRVEVNGEDNYWSDHNPVISTLTYNNAAAPPPAAPTATPTITPTPGGNSPNPAVIKSRPSIEEMSNYRENRWDEVMYYVFFSIGYLTLIRFGFYIHRFFSFFLLTLVFAAGLGITFAFGLPAGLFVVIMGSFMIMMQ